MIDMEKLELNEVALNTHIEELSAYLNLAIIKANKTEYRPEIVKFLKKIQVSLYNMMATDFCESSFVGIGEAITISEIDAECDKIKSKLVISEEAVMSQGKNELATFISIAKVMCDKISISLAKLTLRPLPLSKSTVIKASLLPYFASLSKFLRCLVQYFNSLATGERQY